MNTKEKKRDPYELKDIYSEMELELVASFHRNLIKHGIEEYQAGFSWEMWQVSLLRNMEQYRKENMEIIGKAKPHVQHAIEAVLKDKYEKGYSSTDKIKMPKDGLNIAKPGETPPPEDKFFGMNKNKLNALVKTMKNDFEKADNAIYRKMDDVYRQTIAKVEYQMSTGAMSLNKAIDKATEIFLEQGINCIAYKDKDGEILRYVNIATYAEMALRTASQRAVFLGEGTKRDELGVHLVTVSAHANACEMCLRWQGQILIDDVFSHPSEEYIAKYKEKYQLLSYAIKTGLLHPNCRHTLSTYFEGVSRVPTIVDSDIVKKNYAAEQKQRKLENLIRKAKREYAGVVDEDNKNESKKRVLMYQKQLRDHLKSNPQLKRRNHREKIYDSSQSSFRKLKEFYAMDDKNVRMKVTNIEAGIADKKYETAYIYDQKGNVLLKKKGNESEIEFSESELKLMKDAVVTHNHPSNTTFSPDDIYMMIEHNLQELRAVGEKRTYVLRRNENLHLMPTYVAFVDEYKYIIEIYKKSYMKKYTGKLDRLKRQQIVQANAMNYMSKKYGFIYWREVNEI